MGSRRSPHLRTGQKVTDSTQSQLQLSFSSAEDLAAQNPKYANEITAAAKSSFLQGDQWAYTAGIVAVVWVRPSSSSFSRGGPASGSYSPTTTLRTRRLPSSPPAPGRA